MSIDDFLDNFKLEVKAHPEFAWRLLYGRHLRATIGDSFPLYCPLTFMAQIKGGFFQTDEWKLAANHIGIPINDAADIANSADTSYQFSRNQEIREQLLSLTGLEDK